MDLELKYLHSFYEVIQQGSLLRAAGKLHLTQPALTYHIKMLEQSLGVLLFERSGKKLFLTSKGRLLKEYCDRFFDEWETVRKKLKTETPPLLQETRIAAVSTFGRYVIFPILMKKIFKGFRIQLSYREIEEIFNLVMNGEADIGLTAATKSTSSLLFELLYREEFVLIGHRHFPEKEKELKKLAYYESQDFVSYEESDFVFSKWFETLFNRRTKIIKTDWHVDEIEEVLELVADKRGLSIVPRHAVEASSKKRGIKIIHPFEKKRVFNNIYLVTRNSNFMEHTTKAVVDLLKEELKVKVVLYRHEKG